MKILHLLTSINTGGAEKFCVDICNTQANISSNDIYLCVLDKINDDQPLVQMISPNVNLISLNKQGGYSLKIIYKIYKMLSKINPDIIHINGRALIYSSIPILLKRISSVYTVHTMADKEYSKYIRSYIKFLFNQTPSLFSPVAIGQSVSESIKKIYGTHLDTVIYNGSSELTLSSESKDVLDYIDELKTNEETLVFVYIGRIQKIKNTLLLIQVFNQLVENNKNILLLIIGYDPVPGRAYFNLCKNKNKYPNKIKFLGRKDNVADYLECADASCLTSTYEGLGIVALESFSLGTPVISTPSGGPSDIIIPGVNGYISEQISVQSYIEVLNDFINNPLRNKEKIIEIYEDKYTMKACASQYLNLYKLKSALVK